jgi:hypothetical protein
MAERSLREARSVLGSLGRYEFFVFNSSCYPLTFHFSTVGERTTNDVKAQLAKLEAEAVANGAAALHETSPSAFLIQGLELEELQ